MSTHVMRRTYLLIPFVLALVACQDTTSPEVASSTNGLKPRFTQGDGGVWTVNSLADPGDGTCDDTECTLREAINAASSGDIVFESSLQGDIDLTAGQIAIVQKNLNIDGAGRIAIDAQGNSRGIFVTSIILPPVVRLARLTVKNGSSGSGQGGGVFVGSANLTLDSITLSNNAADGNGGGIHAISSTVTIRNSTISEDSTSASGGGIDCEDGSLTLIKSTVDNNFAHDGGGGIHHTCTVIVTASTISGNYGGDTGGIVTAPGGSLQLQSTTITRNKGTNGGINTAGFPETIVANSIIAGNTGDPKIGVRDCLGATSVGHNLTVVGGGCSFSSAGDVQVLLSQLNTQVVEADLKDNGGPTRTHALISRGFATDAGYCPGETVDQRGFARPVDDPTMPNSLDGCDIGPYELQGPVAVIADLMTSQAVDKTSVKQGDLLTYYVRVQNLGPQTAPNVVVSDVLSSGVTFYSAHSSKGTFTAPPGGETGTVTWNIGDMLNQANEVAEIAVTVLVRGNTTITSTATATANVVDPKTSNNSASITVSVVFGGGKAGGGGGKGGGPKK